MPYCCEIRVLQVTYSKKWLLPISTSLKHLRGFVLPAYAIVASPPFKNLYSMILFWLSGQRCQKCVYINFGKRPLVAGLKIKIQKQLQFWPFWILWGNLNIIYYHMPLEMTPRARLHFNLQLQIGRWCFCSNSYGKIAEEKDYYCNTPCEGNIQGRCGYNWMAAVYDVGFKDLSTCSKRK